MQAVQKINGRAVQVVAAAVVLPDDPATMNAAINTRLNIDGREVEMGGGWLVAGTFQPYEGHENCPGLRYDGQLGEISGDDLLDALDELAAIVRASPIVREAVARHYA
jgi:hypothetical protein